MNPNRLEDVRLERWQRLLAELASDIRRAAEDDRLDAARAALEASGVPMLDRERQRSIAEDRLKVAEAAFANPRLRNLFPFESVGRLCFSRCSMYPFTNDCPCISRFGSVEKYSVCKRPYEQNLGPGVVIGETTSAIEAVEIAAAALPVNAAHVWLGNNVRPRE